MIIDAILTKRQNAKASEAKAESRGKQSHIISLIKGISWRVVGTIDTMMIAYLVTGKVQMALSIGSVEVFTKIILYYLHERAWEAVSAKRDSASK